MGFCSLQRLPQHLPSYTLSFCMFRIQKNPKNIQEKHLLWYDYPRSHLASSLIFTEGSSELSNSDLQVKALLPWLLLKNLALSASPIISWPPVYPQGLNPAQPHPSSLESLTAALLRGRGSLSQTLTQIFSSLSKTTLHVAYSASH